jgi:hypothetical protein
MAQPVGGLKEWVLFHDELNMAGRQSLKRSNQQSTRHDNYSRSPNIFVNARERHG